MLNVIVLAGIQSTKRWSEAGNKALYTINGRMMVEYVLDAVKNANGIGKIVVVGPRKDLELHLKDMVDSVIDSNGTIMENIVNGVHYLGYDQKLMICSSDIPLLTTEAVNDFIDNCEALQADLCYPIIEKSIIERKYPGSKRTYVKVREGTFTGGNIFYIDPRVIKKGFHLAVRLVDARKEPLKMARILGFGFLLRLITGTLSISKVEKKFSKVLGIKGKAVISNYPEIGNDVDKASDVVIAQAYLSQ